VDSGAALTPFSLRSSYRSAYPVDRNNGAVWEGKGATLSLVGGARYLGRHLRVTLAPQVAFKQNADFMTAPVVIATHPLSYPFLRIDWPQRFGEAAFWTLHPGESAITASWGAVEVQAGTDNLWWGPARRYPILLSNTGPGFPHAGIGLSRPVWIGFGDLKAHLTWGQLDESDYFDDDPTDDLRLFTGVLVEFQPYALPGLTLGLAGVQHNHWTDASRLAFNIFTFPFTKKESSEGNGLLSVTAEWVLPERGFAAYMEWAREDYWLNLEDILTEPDHSQGYTLGFEQIYRREGADYRITYELIHLGMAATEQTGRSMEGARFYYHNNLVQGHTHRGQLLGAWIGMGSDAQHFSATAELERRALGFYAERVRRDEDMYYAAFDHLYGFRGHDLEWTLGMHGLERAGTLELQWQGGVSRRKNRSFIGLDGVSWKFRRETNLELSVTAWWLPGR
jgi:hypothetical protein